MAYESTRLRNPLLVPDLFYLFLDLLVIPPNGREESEERRTIAALARTCRAFSEPSLDRLWRRLDSLLPLIRCFGGAVEGTRVKIPSSPFEWHVVNKYSPRIEELTLGNECLSLQFLRSTKLALSNLRVLRWESPLIATDRKRISSIDSVMSLWPLLSTKMDTLEVVVTYVDRPKFALFLNAYPFPPNLKAIRLELPSSNQEPAFTKALSRAICSRHDWQRVELTPTIDAATFRHLAMSSTLKVASLTLTAQTTESNETYFELADIPFRNVRQLNLRLPDCLGFAANLLRPRDQMFHDLIIIGPMSTVAGMSSLLMAIASPWRMRSLQSLILYQYELLTPSRDLLPEKLSYDTLYSLTFLTHLRKLHVRLNRFKISLDDKEFASLVCNWPLLENLVWVGVYEGYPAKSVTLKGFLSLLAFCGSLRRVRITVDATQVSLDTHKDFTKISVSPPQIVFENSPIENPKMVSEFFSKYLPCVVICSQFTRSITEIDNRDYGQLWSQVNTSSQDGQRQASGLKTTGCQY